MDKSYHFLNTKENLNQLYEEYFIKKYDKFDDFLNYLKSNYPEKDVLIDIKFFNSEIIIVPNYNENNLPSVLKYPLGHIIIAGHQLYINSPVKKFKELYDNIVSYDYCQMFGYLHFINLKQKYGYPVKYLVLDKKNNWVINMLNGDVEFIGEDTFIYEDLDEKEVLEDILPHNYIDKYGWDNIVLTDKKFQLSTTEIFNFKNGIITKIDIEKPKGK